MQIVVVKFWEVRESKSWKSDVLPTLMWILLRPKWIILYHPALTYDVWSSLSSRYLFWNSRLREHPFRPQTRTTLITFRNFRQVKEEILTWNWATVVSFYIFSSIHCITDIIPVAVGSHILATLLGKDGITYFWVAEWGNEWLNKNLWWQMLHIGL